MDGMNLFFQNNNNLSCDDYKENNAEKFTKSTYHQARISLFDARSRSAFATIKEVERPHRRLITDYP